MQNTDDLRNEALDPTVEPELDLSDLGGSRGFSKLDASNADDWNRQAAVVLPAHTRWSRFVTAMNDAQDRLDDARRDKRVDVIEELAAASEAAFHLQNAEREPLTELVRSFGFDTFEEWDASRIEFRRQHPHL